MVVKQDVECPNIVYFGNRAENSTENSEKQRHNIRHLEYVIYLVLACNLGNLNIRRILFFCRKNFVNGNAQNVGKYGKN